MNRSRRLAATGIFALAIMVAGCFKANVELTIAEDGTVRGTMVFAYLRGALDQANLTAEGAIARLRHELIADAADGVACSEHFAAPWIGLTCTLEDLSLAEMSDQDAFGRRLSFTRSSESIVIDGVVDLQRDWANQHAVDISLAVSFPWPVVRSTSTGEVDGNTVRWTFEPDTTTEVYALAAAPPAPLISPSTLGWVVPVVAVTGILLVGVVGGRYVRSRYQRSS